jgi:general secretion pathway protein D
MLITSKPPTLGRRHAGKFRSGVVIACALGPMAACGLCWPACGQTPELVPANQPLPADENGGQARPDAGAGDLATPPSDQPKPALAEALDRPGDVTFRNMTIDAALFTIGETWQVNIVTGKEIQGAVNGVFKQTPLREILDAVLLANGYSYRAVGDSLVVQGAGAVGSANPLFRSMTLPIQHSNLAEVAEGAKLLKSEGGQVQALPSARSVLVIDFADRVESIAAFIERMEAAAAPLAGSSAAGAQGRLEVSYFRTHFIPAANAEQPLLAVLSPMGRVVPMPNENRLIVVDYAANMEMVRKVLARIDRPRPQVRITALIYDLSLQDVEQLGLNWGSAGKGNTINPNDGLANQALVFETTTLAPFQTGEAGGALTVRSLTRNFDIQSVALLLQTANDARLLANPNVLVEDNEDATWKSVSEIPYQQITQSELGGQIGTTAFKEAGITLVVHPTVAGDGTIEMLIEPEFSRLAGFTPQESQPIIDTRKATTTVRVANRQTLVLSGLRQRSDTGEFNGIPVLKDIKFIGPIFRSRDTNVRESELIVFIMPEIVGYDDPPGCREYSALETIDCRLDGIPAPEGCPPIDVGADGCAGVELTPLPPIDGHGDTAGAAAPTATDAKPQSAAPMRPAYEARFQANNPAGTPRQLAQPPDGKKKSVWKRMFGS